MNIIISSGHGKLIRGASGILDEVDEARKVAECTAEKLRNCEAQVKVFHDDVSKTQSENLERIVDYHNSQERQLDISVHFNAYVETTNPMGCEVLYQSQSAMANEVSAAIAKAGHFINRGAKKRTDLYFLNQTDMPAILIEVCFVDSQADADLYQKYFEEICQAIATSLVPFFTLEEAALEEAEILPGEEGEVLLKINGVPVYIEMDAEGREHLWWTGEYTVDGDGSPRCYGPSGTQPLDYLGNAGSPGNWWGIATDNQCSNGDPVVQGSQNPCPGYYVSTTAYIVPGYYWYDPRHYLDSEKILFAVIPGNVRSACIGICKGCKAQVTDKKTGKVIECVIGDIGPSDHLGEGSIAMAAAFGLDPSPKSGGSSDESRFLWECWPGVAAKGFVLQ